MSIATKTGDDGNTGLFGGRRVPKDDLRIEAYGSIDELNSALGVLRAASLPASLDVSIRRIQGDLFDLGAELATPRENNPHCHKVAPFPQAALEAVEADLRCIEDSLPPLTCFILPGGHPTAAWLQFCRALCRRAERAVVSLARQERLPGVALRYLNRLSDLFFILARDVNVREGVPEPEWRGREP